MIRMTYREQEDHIVQQLKDIQEQQSSLDQQLRTNKEHAEYMHQLHIKTTHIFNHLQGSWQHDHYFKRLIANQRTDIEQQERKLIDTFETNNEDIHKKQQLLHQEENHLYKQHHTLKQEERR